METARMTMARLVLAIISTALQEAAIYVIWRWLLPDFDIYLPVSVLVAVMIFWGILAVSLFIFTTRTLKKQTVVGLPTMIGSRGKAAGRLSPEGMVRIKGELWAAVADGDGIDKGEWVEVVGEDGLKLVVRRTKR